MGDEAVRPYLTALATLLAAMLLYQGLVLRGLIAGEAGSLEPAAAALLLAAAATMGLAAVTLRGHAGLAAVEMTLAGVVVMSIAGPGHRYLLAYGGVAVVLAVFAAIAAASPPPPASAGRRPARQDLRPSTAANPDAAIDPAPSPAAAQPSSQPARPEPAAAQRALRRVGDARGRRLAARQAWRGWRADPAPAQEPPPEAPELPETPGAVIAASERARGNSSGQAETTA
jgi:hypothetical protein